MFQTEVYIASILRSCEFLGFDRIGWFDFLLRASGMM